MFSALIQWPQPLSTIPQNLGPPKRRQYTVEFSRSRPQTSFPIPVTFFFATPQRKKTRSDKLSEREEGGGNMRRIKLRKRDEGLEKRLEFLAEEQNHFVILSTPLSRGGEGGWQPLSRGGMAPLSYRVS